MSDEVLDGEISHGDGFLLMLKNIILQNGAGSNPSNRVV